ncbi:MAG TPA: hypothetical protein VGM31_14210 [Puia sp.]|jgi:hypothetical protein
MKKSQLLLIATLFSLLACGQSKADSTQLTPKDTTQKAASPQPVVLRPHTQLTPVTIIYKAAKKRVLWLDGWYQQIGLIYPTGQWAEKPTEALLDEQKKPVIKDDVISVTAR